MDFVNEILSEPEFSSLERDLDAVRLNDYHFTDQERQAALQRLSRRMSDWDRCRQWRLTMAAVLVVLLAGGCITLWHFISHEEPFRQENIIVPRSADMVLTTTDGHSLNLSEGGLLVCSELGYLTIKGARQTLVCTPSPRSEQTSDNGQMCELRVPEGKRTRIELSDGSIVWVNSATTVRFPIKFSGAERCIEIDGEVYLEGVHRSENPFCVRTNGFSVQVEGTKFGVTAYSGQRMSQVVLAEGRVSVSVGDSLTSTLQPGQLLRLDADGNALTTDVEAYTYTSWKDGLLYFDGTPLNEALERLSKQYAVDIHCSPGSAQLKLYGKLVLEDHIESALDNLTVIEPISYTVRNNQVFVEEK